MSAPIGVVGDGGIAARREVAERAAREAGNALAAAFGGSFRVENKGAIDLVTEMDRVAEKIVLERIRAAFPRDAVMAEESGGALASGNLWIVDPLDGTTNFAHGHPQFCVSIGFAIAGEPRCGVIYDPLRAEMFCAEKGRGATLNGKPLRVSGVATLNESLVATGFPYDRRERADFYMPFYRAAVIATQGVRRAGAAALDLAWVACGRFDAYFEFGIKPWDVCAGSLLVTEAGGKMSDMRGGPHRLDAPHVLASNGLLHEEAMGLIASAWPPAT